MVALHELNHDWIDPDNDPLVRRLRDLEWTQASPEVRERCWEGINERMAAAVAAQPVGQPVGSLRDVAERYDFSRRQAPCRDAVAQAWSRRTQLLGSRSSTLQPRSALAFS